MKITGLALLSLLVISCGGSDSEAPPANHDAAPMGRSPGPDAAPEAQADAFVDPLIGTWIDELTDGSGVVRFRFDGDNWELDILAVLTDGSIGMQIEQGDYVVTSPTSAKLYLKSSSCQGVKTYSGNTISLTFERSGTSLSTTMGTSFLVFQAKTTPPTGMGSATIGCLQDDGTFVAHATSPVP